MKTRAEYVARFKTQLERWNADVTKWEARASSAGADEKIAYAGLLETIRSRKNAALENLHMIEKSTPAAWPMLSPLADEAWNRMQEAVEEARSRFEKRS